MHFEPAVSLYLPSSEMFDAQPFASGVTSTLGKLRFVPSTPGGPNLPANKKSPFGFETPADANVLLFLRFPRYDAKPYLLFIDINGLHSSVTRRRIPSARCTS